MPTDPTRPVYQYPDAPIPADLSAMLQADAIAVRDALEAARRRWEWIRTLGQEAVPEDVWNGYERMGGTVAAIYFGLVAQPEPFSFDNYLVPARRGQ